MLDQRLRRWPNINPTLGQRRVGLEARRGIVLSGLAYDRCLQNVAVI